MAILLIRAALLTMSMYGYIQYLRKKVDISFTLGIIFSAIGSVMFIAGILNILKEATIIVLLLGIYLACISIKEKDSVKCMCSYGMIFFVVMSAFMVFVLKDAKFVHYDNFSHWALAAKVIISQDSFPNFLNTHVVFQGYPLGSAAFIYYFVKVLGLSQEWVQMLVQAVLEIGMLISLFAFAKTIKSKVIISAIIIFILTGNISFTELLVDTLVSVTAISAVIFCMYYAEVLTEKLYYIIPFVVFLIAIKSSGMVFVIIVLAYTLWCTEKNKDGIKKWLTLAISSVAVLLLWQRHVAQVFKKGMTSKHAVSMENFKDSFFAKTPEEIKEFVTVFYNKVISFSNEAIYLLVFIVAAVIMYKLINKKINKTLIHAVSLALMSYVAFQIGLFGMYIFNMPISGSIGLASYDRYHKTIIMFCLGILCIIICQFDFKTDKKNIKNICGYLIICTLFAWSLNSSLPVQMSQYTKQKDITYARHIIEEIVEENNIPSGSSYMVVVDSGYSDGGYLMYVCRYLFNTSEVTIKPIDKLAQENHGWLGKSYLLVYDTSDEILNYIESEFGENHSRAIELPSSVDG